MSYLVSFALHYAKKWSRNDLQLGKILQLMRGLNREVEPFTLIIATKCHRANWSL
jgi:hypothetical protein